MIKVLYRNVAKELKLFAKLCLYKLLVLAVLMCGLNCAQIKRTDMVKLEKIQKKKIQFLSSHLRKLSKNVCNTEIHFCIKLSSRRPPQKFYAHLWLSHVLITLRFHRAAYNLN